MPTSNPRVNVTLSVSLDALVSRMATHQRVSKSQVLRELLEAAEPALQRAVILMDQATSATRDVHQQLASRLDQQQNAAEVEMRQLMQFTRDLVSQAQAVRGRRPARAGSAERAPVASAGGGAINPPPSNRGVRNGKAVPSNGLQRVKK